MHNSQLKTAIHNSQLKFRYFLRHPATSVQEEDDIWKTPLPMNRGQASVHSHSPKSEKQLAALSPGEKLPDDVFVSHGDYFCAIRSFLEKDGLEIIASEASRGIGQDVEPEHIESIDIYLEKHGEFYHPAQIRALVNGSEASFVLNVAVSEPGKAWIRKEYDILKYLNETFSHHLYIPKIYGQGEICVNNGPDIRMFMGEWFEGYSEFHISRDQADGKNKIVVWDAEQGHFFLSPDKTMELYRQAAMILTSYYNVETFEQICLWHHAAGDFVIKLDKAGEVGLKLVTVRQYASLVHQGGADAILHALLVFLVSLSLRMRVDRLDGVGDIAWADDIAVQGTVEGFFQALESKPLISILPAHITDCFQYYLSLCTETDLCDLSEAIINTYNPMAPELPVMQAHLKTHAATLYHAIHS